MSTSTDSTEPAVAQGDGRTGQAPPPQPGASADEIEQDIERTREQLGETVDALARKLDVKSRARDRVSDIRERARVQADVARSRGADLTARVQRLARDEDGSARPVVPVGAGALVGIAVVVGYLVWRQRR